MILDLVKAILGATVLEFLWVFFLPPELTAFLHFGDILWASLSPYHSRVSLRAALFSGERASQSSPPWTLIHFLWWCQVCGLGHCWLAYRLSMRLLEKLPVNCIKMKSNYSPFCCEATYWCSQQEDSQNKAALTSCKFTVSCCCSIAQLYLFQIPFV